MPNKARVYFIAWGCEIDFDKTWTQVKENQGVQKSNLKLRDLESEAGSHWQQNLRWKGLVGGQRVYTRNRRRVKKLIPVETGK